jgi:hypothetical protein
MDGATYFARAVSYRHILFLLLTSGFKIIILSFAMMKKNKGVCPWLAYPLLSRPGAYPMLKPLKSASLEWAL